MSSDVFAMMVVCVAIGIIAVFVSYIAGKDAGETKIRNEALKLGLGRQSCTPGGTVYWWWKGQKLTDEETEHVAEFNRQVQECKNDHSNPKH